MKTFKNGDIVFYHKENLVCLIKEISSNSLFERKYSLVSYDPVDGRYPRFICKNKHKLEHIKEYRRRTKIDILLNE